MDGPLWDGIEDLTDLRGHFAEVFNGGSRLEGHVVHGVLPLKQAARDDGDDAGKMEQLSQNVGLYGKDKTFTTKQINEKKQQQNSRNLIWKNSKKKIQKNSFEKNQKFKKLI